jgi:hypothetical protein
MCMNSRNCLIAMFVAGSLLAAAAAVARDGDPASDAAQVAFEKGKKLVEDGRFTEAADAFREAHRLRPSWKILYNIGQCEMMAKRHGLALEAFERYLSEGGDEIKKDRRDEVLADVVRLREMVGFVDIRAGAGATVTVDGVERGRAPLPGPITVEAGVEHRVLAVGGGAVLVDRIVRVSGGQTLVVEAGAEGPPAAVEGQLEPESATDEPGDDRPSSDRTVWGWSVTGVGAALLVAGAVTGSLALSLNSEIGDNCPDGGCPPAWHDDVDRRDSLALSTNVLLGTGAAAAVVGVLLLTVFRGEEPLQVTARHDGAAVGGRF